jgi:hypothetical protein
MRSIPTMIETKKVIYGVNLFCLVFNLVIDLRVNFCKKVYKKELTNLINFCKKVYIMINKPLLRQ